MGELQKRIDAEREFLAKTTEQWRKKNKQLFSTSVSNFIMFSHWIEEAKKEFLDLPRSDSAELEWFVKWFGE